MLHLFYACPICNFSIFDGKCSATDSVDIGGMGIDPSARYSQLADRPGEKKQSVIRRSSCSSYVLENIDTYLIFNFSCNAWNAVLV